MKIFGILVLVTISLTTFAGENNCQITSITYQGKKELALKFGEKKSRSLTRESVKIETSWNYELYNFWPDMHLFAKEYIQKSLKEKNCSIDQNLVKCRLVEDSIEILNVSNGKVIHTIQQLEDKHMEDIRSDIVSTGICH